MKDLLESPYKLRTKPITTAKKLPQEQQIRDTFQTPRYATELLIPFIPKNITRVWECSAGKRKISTVLENYGLEVVSTDLKESEGVSRANFLVDSPDEFSINKISDKSNFAIITNPPYSVKEEFVDRCFYYEVPFALLINADYSQWQIDLIVRGCEKIVPTRRIAYITPNILQRVHEGEVFNLLKKREGIVLNLQQMKSQVPEVWKSRLNVYEDVHNYSKIEDVPGKLLKKYSASQFHSMWLTYGFNLGKSEVFVDLPLNVMENF